ncbi:MAG: helix-turn-helix transcriptional regulator, partial [Hyphomicrobiales bacterium]|nr:helix-turn-helix transcriptional regulator [Hyphomicrobiales bacterium]
PAISRHLRVLEAAELIDRRIDARWRVCSLKRERLAEAQGWIGEIRQFWESGFDRLEALLRAQNERINERPPDRDKE